MKCSVRKHHAVPLCALEASRLCRVSRLVLAFVCGENAGSPSDGRTVQALRNTRFFEEIAITEMPSQFHPVDLYARIGTATAPLLIDVRRAPSI